MAANRPTGIITPAMVAEATEKYQAELEAKRQAAASTVEIPSYEAYALQASEAGQRSILQDDGNLLVKKDDSFRIYLDETDDGVGIWVNGKQMRAGKGEELAVPRFLGMITAYLNVILEQLPCQRDSRGVPACSRNELADNMEVITAATNNLMQRLTMYDPAVADMYNLRSFAKGTEVRLDPRFVPYAPHEDDVPPKPGDGFSELEIEELWGEEHAQQADDYYAFWDAYDDREASKPATKVTVIEEDDDDDDDDTSWGYYDSRTCAYDPMSVDTPPGGYTNPIWDWYDFEGCWNPEINESLASSHFICTPECDPYMISIGGFPVIDNKQLNSLDSCPASPDDMILPLTSFLGYLEEGVRDIFIDLARRAETEGITLGKAQLYLTLVGNPVFRDFINDPDEYSDQPHISFSARRAPWGRFRKILIDTLGGLLDYDIDPEPDSMPEAEWIDAEDVIGRYVDVAAYKTYTEYHKNYLNKKCEEKVV